MATSTSDSNGTEREVASADPALCRLAVHSFSEKLLDTEIFFHVTKLMDSFLLWIGNKPARMSNLAVALNTRCDKVPSAAMLLGDTANTQPSTLAQKLAKSTGKQVFVSCSLPLMDQMLVSLVEKRIKEELKANPQCF
ncbi:proteasome assembly chaperone 4-like [Diadema antillarum]|uniref:proteasome assembly chaperone 4-like n=1 Tax=Diadema antillarum TaxID=105358 RepID=UPI003A83E7C3